MTTCVLQEKITQLEKYESIKDYQYGYHIELIYPYSSFYFKYASVGEWYKFLSNSKSTLYGQSLTNRYIWTARYKPSGFYRWENDRARDLVKITMNIQTKTKINQLDFRMRMIKSLKPLEVNIDEIDISLILNELSATKGFEQGYRLIGELRKV